MLKRNNQNDTFYHNSENWFVKRKKTRVKKVLINAKGVFYVLKRIF